MLALLLLAAEPGEIVVTGSGLAAGAGEIAYDSVAIDRDRLATAASGRIEDVLRDAAGFTQFRRSDAGSAHPTSQGVTLRGLGGNAASRALVLLDGVPQADPFGGWIAWPALDPARLGLVRVVRGGGSGASGPGALAGTILLDSARIDQLGTYWAEASSGSRGSIDAGAGIAGALGGGRGVLSARYRRSDGFVPTIAADRGPVDIAAPYAQASLAGRAVFPLTPATELQAAMLLFSDVRSRGTAFTRNRSVGADASLRLVGHGAIAFEATAWLKARQFASGFASINDARTVVTQSNDQYAVPATGVGGRIELRPAIGHILELRIGADTEHDAGATHELYSYVAGSATRGRIAGGDTLTAGAFAELTARASDTLTLTAGGRLDHWTITDGRLEERLLATQAPVTDARYSGRAGWRPTARGGAAWRPGDGAVTLRSAAYLGWRLPTLNELYRPYRVGSDSIAANPALAAERLRGIDAGIDYRPISSAQLSASVFANRLDDAIANVTQSQSSIARTLQRENLDAIVSRGVELDGRIALGAWRLSGSYALTDARVHAHAIAAPLDRLRPAETPRVQASGTIAWHARHGAEASATLRYTAAQFDDDLNSERLAPAVTLDLSAGLPIAQGLALTARAENVTDRRVEAGISGNGIIERATPRTLWIGISVRG